MIMVKLNTKTPKRKYLSCVCLDVVWILNLDQQNWFSGLFFIHWLHIWKQAMIVCLMFYKLFYVCFFSTVLLNQPLNGKWIFEICCFCFSTIFDSMMMVITSFVCYKIQFLWLEHAIDLYIIQKWIQFGINLQLYILDSRKFNSTI